MQEIENLSSREYSVLSLYLGLNENGLTMTKSQIAKAYGISVPRVNTVIAQAYQKLATDRFKQLLLQSRNEVNT